MLGSRDYPNLVFRPRFDPLGVKLFKVEQAQISVQEVTSSLGIRQRFSAFLRRRSIPKAVIHNG